MAIYNAVENNCADLRMIPVLDVGDDPSLLEISKFYHEDTGEFHIDTIESAPHVPDILQHRSYDAVISDCQIPEMNGIEFLKILRKNTRSSRSLFLQGKPGKRLPSLPHGIYLIPVFGFTPGPEPSYDPP